LTNIEQKIQQRDTPAVIEPAVIEDEVIEDDK
jgi:hypothetical protein